MRINPDPKYELPRYHQEVEHIKSLHPNVIFSVNYPTLEDKHPKWTCWIVVDKDEIFNMKEVLCQTNMDSNNPVWKNNE